MTGLNKPVTDEQLGRLSKKWRAIQEKLEAGALPFDQVFGAFQAIHDEHFGDNVAPVTHQRARKIQLIHGMFVPPEVQIENVRRWNEKERKNELRFGNDVFKSLPQPPAWPNGRLAVVALVPYKPTIQATFDGLWGIAASRQKKHWRWDQLLSDPDNLRLLDGITHPEMSLRWEVIDLGANWDKKDGTSQESVRSAESSPHAGILAAAAHHPKWVQAMDGVNIPFVWISGYEANIPGFGRLRYTPSLDFYCNDRMVRLSAGRCDRRVRDYAVPSFRGSAQN